MKFGSFMKFNQVVSVLFLSVIALSPFLISCGSPRVVDIDITDEMICRGKYLTNVSEKCSTQIGCESVCLNTACESYGMKFQSALYSENKCLCSCIAENKIRTVAKYYDE